MTKNETKMLKKAIRLLHEDGSDYFTGMNMLAKLVGWKPIKLPDDLVPVDIVKEYLNGRDQKFIA